MGVDTNLRLRWFGVGVLAAALGMLIAGETVLRDRLQALGFLLYWFICFCLTGLAVVIALVDARSLRERARAQRRDLLQTALKDIQLEAKARSQDEVQRRKG